MRRLDVGLLPVVTDRGLIGVLTDRDIAVRAAAAGLQPGATPVRQVMSLGAVACLAKHPVEQAAEIMRERGVRRLLVVDDHRKLVGVVSSSDLPD